MKREKIYNYFYIVNNLLNGHFYLGVHSTDTLADGYKGSGKALKLAIKKHGKENFELVPLKFFKTRKELMDFEREIVNERFLTYYKGICYNLKRGGEGGHYNVNMTEEDELQWKKQIGSSVKNTWDSKTQAEIDDWKSKISNTLKGHEVSETTKNKISKTLTGRTTSEDVKIKQSNSLKGKNSKPLCITDIMPQDKLEQYNLNVGDIFESGNILSDVVKLHRSSVNKWRQRGWVKFAPGSD